MFGGFLAYIWNRNRIVAPISEEKKPTKVEVHTVEDSINLSDVLYELLENEYEDSSTEPSWPDPVLDDEDDDGEDDDDNWGE
jgi:hypothetical protein